MKLACSHRPPCPGCPSFGAGGIEPGALEKLCELASQVGIAAPQVIRSRAEGYRCHARLAVRGRASSPKVGIFELGTHRLVHIPRCVIHDSRINYVAHELERSIRELRVPPYSDTAHAGLIRYLIVGVTAPRSDAVDAGAQVTLVLNAETHESGLPLAKNLSARLGERLHSLWINLQSERSNAIVGREFHHVSGPLALRDRVGSAVVHYPPGAFAQKNPELFEKLVLHLSEWVPEGARVLELYAGTGAIGLNLLGRCKSYSLNEISPPGLAGLELGLGELSPSLRDKAIVLPGAASECAGRVRDADVVIADPPRKGLDLEVRSALATDLHGRFIYVSCGLESFLEDAAALLGAGLKLRELTAYAMFPFTEHVETVAVFER